MKNKDLQTIFECYLQYLNGALCLIKDLKERIGEDGSTENEEIIQISKKLKLLNKTLKKLIKKSKNILFYEKETTITENSTIKNKCRVIAFPYDPGDTYVYPDEYPLNIHQFKDF